MSDPQRPGIDDAALGKMLNWWLAAGVVAGVLLVAAFPTYRLVEGDRREGALERQLAAQVAMGHEIWGAACADCHGEQGEGEIGSPALNSAEFFAAATQQQVHHVIQSGVPGTDMLAWWNEFGGALTDQQIRSLVVYIYEWEEGAPDRPDWRDPGGEGPMDGGNGGNHEDPPDVGHETIVVGITVGDADCGPLEFEVMAGTPFVIEFENQASGTRSLEFQGVDDHIHANPGETTTVEVAALDPGDYRFECLGTGHAAVLGSGVIRATEGMPDESPLHGDEEGLVVGITVGDADCGPLEFEVMAGTPFVIEFENQASGTRSLEFQGVDDHIHANPGETTTVEVAALDPGNYRFECLGTGHAAVLGSGVIRVP